MQLSLTTALSIAALSASTSASSVFDPPVFPPPTLPPKLTPAFEIKVHALDYQTPIPRFLGGYQSVYPLVNGSITGSALNGTILRGVAAPEVTDDGVYALSLRRYYGNTTDGEDFWIEQKGVGHYTREQSWLAITIGGKYAYLQHIFLLAQNNVDVATRTGKVTVYAVNEQDQR